MTYIKEKKAWQSLPEKKYFWINLDNSVIVCLMKSITCTYPCVNSGAGVNAEQGSRDSSGMFPRCSLECDAL